MGSHDCLPSKQTSQRVNPVEPKEREHCMEN